MEVNEVMRPAIPRPKIPKQGTKKINTDERPGDGSNDDFKEGEEMRYTRITGNTKAMERGADILWTMLTSYGSAAIAVFGVPVGVVGPCEVVGDGAELICVAQVSMYMFVTPAPLAFGPD